MLLMADLEGSISRKHFVKADFRLRLFGKRCDYFNTNNLDNVMLKPQVNFKVGVEYTQQKMFLRLNCFSC